MYIAESRRGDLVVLDVHAARVDAAGVTEFQRGAATAIGASRKVVLDLSRVSFVDSSGLGALVALKKLMGPEGRLAFAGVQPSVATLLKLTRLDKVFPVFFSVADAVAATA